MAVVVYKCDTCKRAEQIPQNIYGLEVIGRCVFTLGCRGKLSQTDYLPDHTRAALPDNVPGLTNWEPRNVLFNFTQTITNNKWTIVHNLGTFPAVVVFVNVPTSSDPHATQQIIPDVSIVSPNELILEFDRPYSGVAQLIARSSDPTLLQETITTTPQPSTAPVQLTNLGYFTIATRVDKFGSLTGMNIETQLTLNGGQTSSSTFASSTSLDSNTAWSDITKVVIRGKVYILREFNALTGDIRTGQVAIGTLFRFQGFDVTLDSIIDYVVDSVDQVSLSPPLIQPGDMYLLLSNSPFTTVDKNTTQIVDITSVTTTKNSDSFFYSNLEFFVEPSIIQNIYPPIRSVG